ncbi:hypothetical protein C3V43_09950 [Bacteroides heparinolyticus]|nr:hypothetical protein C3V43_09950 [Bacteroides heparinolyticus]
MRGKNALFEETTPATDSCSRGKFLFFGIMTQPQIIYSHYPMSVGERLFFRSNFPIASVVVIIAQCPTDYTLVDKICQALVRYLGRIRFSIYNSNTRIQSD